MFVPIKNGGKSKTGILKESLGSWYLILLMEEILHHGGCIKSSEKWDEILSPHDFRIGIWMLPHGNCGDSLIPLMSDYTFQWSWGVEKFAAVLPIEAYRILIFMNLETCVSTTSKIHEDDCPSQKNTGLNIVDINCFWSQFSLIRQEIRWRVMTHDG